MADRLDTATETLLYALMASEKCIHDTFQFNDVTSGRFETFFFACRLYYFRLCFLELGDALQRSERLHTDYSLKLRGYFVTTKTRTQNW